MGLEMLSQADYVLNACGRPVPPEGYRFVDLPRVIPFEATLGAQPAGPAGPPFQARAQNTAATLFLCCGLAIRGLVPWRLKWPSGRFLSQGVTGNTTDSGVCAPLGTGNGMLALDAEEPIPAGGRIALELVGGQVPSGVGPPPPPSGIVGTDTFHFWGVLRYLLRDTGAGSGGNDGSVSCIVGYPTEGQSAARRAGRNVVVTMMEDPVQALENRPRYFCGPNQNIMAPEFRLGNQCPPSDVVLEEPFTFFSPEIFVPVGQSVYSTAVIVPGNEDVWIRRVRARNEYSARVGIPTTVYGAPTFSLRLPNGYSVTGGDLIPAGASSINTALPANIAPLFQWLPIFPLLRVRAGDRLIIDMSNIDASPAGDATKGITTKFEFDAVKRRRVSV